MFRPLSASSGSGNRSEEALVPGRCQFCCSPAQGIVQRQTPRFVSRLRHRLPATHAGGGLEFKDALGSPSCARQPQLATRMCYLTATLLCMALCFFTNAQLRHCHSHHGKSSPGKGTAHEGLMVSLAACFILCTRLKVHVHRSAT